MQAAARHARYTSCVDSNVVASHQRLTAGLCCCCGARGVAHVLLARASRVRALAASPDAAASRREEDEQQQSLPDGAGYLARRRRAPRRTPPPPRPSEEVDGGARDSDVADDERPTAAEAVVEPANDAALERAAAPAAAVLLLQQHQQSPTTTTARQRQSLAAASRRHERDALLLPVPPRFRPLCRDATRPWVRGVVLHLLEQPPPACHIYAEMRPTTLARVVRDRARAEKALRLHREEADWQLRRGTAWLARCCMSGGGGRVLLRAGSLERADKELMQLRSAVGATRAELARLATDARGYSDGDYEEYAAEALLPLCAQLAAAAEHCRGALLPRVRAACELNERTAAALALAPAPREADALRVRRDREAAALLASGDRDGSGDESGDDNSTSSSGRVVVRMRGWRRAAPWRYPPAEFVLVRPKGVHWTPPLELPGRPRSLPAVRDGVELLQSSSLGGGAADAAATSSGAPLASPFD